MISTTWRNAPELASGRFFVLVPWWCRKWCRDRSSEHRFLQLTYTRDADGLVTAVATQTGALSGNVELCFSAAPSPAVLRGVQTNVAEAGDDSAVNTEILRGPFGEVEVETYRWDSSACAPAVACSAGCIDAGDILLERAYTRDDAGRITDFTETVGGVATVHSYAYDARGRLSSHAVDGVIQATYYYDDNGNREDPPGAPDTRQYDAQDRLLAFDGVSYTHNVQGQRLTATDDATGEVTALDYDAAGNLMAVDLPDGSRVEYETDGQDRRVLKRVFDQNDQFTYSWDYIYHSQLHPEAVLETNSDGTGHVMFFTYGSKGHVPDTMVREGRTYRLMTDHLGSVRRVVDIADGTVVEQLAYDPWGMVLSYTVNEQPVVRAFQPFGFAGGAYDTETGLVRFGARDYEARTGRWLAKDPIRFDGKDPNIYAYVGNDPVNLLDPEGTQYQCTEGTMSTNPACPGAGRAAAAEVAGGALVNGGRIAGATTFAGVYNGLCEAMQMGKASKRTGKERSNDVVSWAKGKSPGPNESCVAFAARLMVMQYGANWKRSGKKHREFSKIKKWCQRHLRGE